MRLTTHTDYSLRVLMFLAARPNGRSTIREIAAAYGISQNHLMKVVFELGRHGFLDNIRGRGGGVRLARPPEQIGIGDIVRTTEQGSALVECFGPLNGCVIAAPCRLKHILGEALDGFLKVLDRYSLADLVHGNRALARILAVA